MAESIGGEEYFADGFYSYGIWMINEFVEKILVHERTKSEKRRRMEEAKATIRAEDMAKGVFIPVSQLPKQEPQKAPAQTCAAV